ncbi:MAG: CocE/NonD family hydrolase [Mesorhizobium sp.]|uniref:CocE/NonD family hydrolase n=1 Tax=unclassified Mesorhizobium TaxID=325217 RepID=UPI000F753DE7|nr:MULTISPECIES: CocE/NonD family hydrolase [unclassified Mesorhizobium]RVC76191.1 CocE/NonD family hydrolase [Mesorhizobium sp. M2A.F.Ca.ET.046.02.1.1]AZO71591.1 CocE/NonD family hydrolase [Mesorhizobium sp. M1D.F.Ca.ET.043.01.1.1]RWB49831.1 MAG: CocE/NonD family hydrolase [Mesorhizobium sp.]RWD00882.1 MAG: CocE/NonD family hydrolase [Mesorhizobium sp.]RWE22680.1 MAG: CocE/NonD family hydrolase [Mesorhizobium sp.]
MIINADLNGTEVVRDIGYVPMADGTRIAYICYYKKAWLSNHCPSVFWYSPYAASFAAFDVAKPFLEAGYAFVGANFPATGCSEGIIDNWMDRKEGVYGAEVVEWIARQPWSDGNVGMIGNSSGGTVQFWVAAERPPHLKAIVPTGVEDGYEDWIYLGGMLQLDITAGWSLNSEFITQVSGAEGRISAGDTECAAIRGSDRQVVKRQFFDEVRKHPLKDEWWDSIFLARDEIAGKVAVPTMIIASWQDTYGCAVRESARVFTELMPNVEHKKLVLMNGDHMIGGPGPNGYSLVDEERMKFLDRWVKGVENGIEDDSPVTVYWEVRQPNGDPKKSVAGWVTRHKTWPEPKVERRPYYLTTDAWISPEKPVASSNEGSRAYLYPAGTELYGSNQQFAIQPYKEGVLNYRTAAAVSDMTLLGNPEITLYLSIDNGDDADLELTLKDIDADGNVLFLQSGLLRASLRAIDDARSSADEVVHLFRKFEKLVPGEIYELRMSLLAPIAHVVRQGHSLELTLGAPNPIPHPNFGSIPAGAPSINRIYHSERYPSKILLPVVMGAVAQAPAPEYSSLRAQPFRKGTEFVPGGLPIP